MNGMKQFLVLGLVLVLSGSVLAAPQRKKDEPLFDQLLRECKLTEDQQTAVKEKIKARDEILAAWDSENAEKVQAAKEAGKEAKSKNDEEARKKASTDSRALRDARVEAGAKANEAIFDVLTDEQKAAWDGYQLYVTVSSRYRRVEPCENQMAKIKDACAVVQKEIVAAEADDDTKTVKELVKRLRWGVEVFILNPDQRKTMRTPREKPKPE